MITLVSQQERRRELRCNCDDVIRWKRPGRIEDHKGNVMDTSLQARMFAVQKWADKQKK